MESLAMRDTASFEKMPLFEKMPFDTEPTDTD